MKNKFLLLALVAVSVLCAGCSTASPQSSYNGYSSSYSYSSYIESSSSSSDYYDYNDDYNDQSYYDDDRNFDDDSWDYDDDGGDYDDLGELTYGDFVVLYRDEIIESAKNVTYQELARSTTGMADEYVKFHGEIIQVLDESSAGYECYSILMNITSNSDGYYIYYTDTVIVNIIKDFIDVRPLEGDIVTVWGISTGFLSYESVLGDIRTEPCIAAAKVEFVV